MTRRLLLFRGKRPRTNTLLMVLWQTVGVGHGACSRNSSSPTLDIPQAVQQTLDVIIERFLLLHRVVEHLAKAGEGRSWGVFKNARFLNTLRKVFFHFHRAGDVHDNPSRHLRLRPGQQG